MKNIIIILFTLSLIGSGCSDGILDQNTSSNQSNSPNSSNPDRDRNGQDNDWLVPVNEVFDGGPGKDGIPSIDNPQFTMATNVDFLNGDDLVLGIRIGDDIKAYPHPILDQHEIVNDDIGGEKIAIIYCPLTGTGMGWSRILNGVETTFGVSGLLYNTNLMPYDRHTNSTWSQMRLDCVNGQLEGEKAKNFAFVEMKFQSWLEAFPTSQILNTNTGFSRNYLRYPYGDYRTNNSSLLFPISRTDARLPGKERVLGVFTGLHPSVFTFNSKGMGLQLFEDEMQGTKIVVAANADKNYLIAFNNPGEKVFTPLNDALPLLMKDEFGNEYDIFGNAVTGPDIGSKLAVPPQFMGFWFSWGTFYPNLRLRKLK